MLKVTQLSCVRQEQAVFSDLTFSVYPGMLLHLSGPNGSGKSSLLKMIAGLLPIEQGLVQSDFSSNTTKQSLTGLLAEDPNYTSNLLYIGHKTGLTLNLSVRENVLLWRSLRCHPHANTDNPASYLSTEIDTVLATLDLKPAENNLCETLSAGQKQKVVLCRLWSEFAPLWLLDEPFTAIDNATQDIIEARIAMHLKAGGAVIMAHHSEMHLWDKLGKNYQILNMQPPVSHISAQTTHVHTQAHNGSMTPNVSLRAKANIAMPMQACLTAVFKRDILLYTRRQSETCLPLIFFIMIVSIFSISLGSTTTALADFAGPILWVGALLAILLSAESLYRNDYESGYLEQLVLNPAPLSSLLLAKMLAHLMGIGLPILIIVPMVGIALQLPIEALAALWMSFLIGIPALCFITSIGSAMLVSLQRGGLLLSILLIPLLMPVIIFGCSALQLVNAGLTWRSECYLLAAALLISALCSPIISAFAIKLGLD